MKNIIEIFESELLKVKRDGMDSLINYIRKSDFYTAPSSTQYHLSVKEGLLQHSLNVLACLKGMLHENEDGTYSYMVAGKEVSRISEETLILITLLHDICKTKFYATEKRNKKIDGTWMEVDIYTINDQIPFGHGEKSVMMISQFIHLSLEEKMAVRWHMGMPEDYAGKQTFNAACQMFPICWALHSADMQAANFMEDKEENKELFR